MSDILGLVLPFFGLIFIGYGLARLVHQPLAALGWMNTFIVYVALPALFVQLVSRTPVEKLTEFGFVFASIAATFLMFALVFAGSLVFGRAGIAESTVKGLASAYGNIGYMGPGLALIAFGEEAAVPVALIFSFENMMHFALAPSLMALAGGEDRPLPRVAIEVVRRIALHPFILATGAGVALAFLGWSLPAPVGRLLDMLARAAAPCALFAMGVTLALRPLRRVPREMAAIAAVKLLLHPLAAWLMLSLVGHFDPVWVYSAVLLAALPTATNVFVIAQQYHVWVERASASVLITTMVSVGTVTALLYAIRTGLLAADLFP